MIDWRHWHNEPYLTGGLILLGWLYAILAGPLRPRLAPGAPYPRLRAFSFYSSLVLFYLAVGSPLDQVGERFLLSAHMVQHLLIIEASPLLLLLGLPAWMIDPALSRPGAARFWRRLFHPFTCAVVFTVVISVWHLSFLYEWTLQQKLAHVAEHLLFFAASLLYWWPLVSPSRRFPVPRPATQMLYIFITEVGLIPVSAYLIFSRDILYATYEYAPRVIAGFTPADDQLIAGLIMKFAGMGVSFIAFAAVFRRWYLESNRREPGGAGGRAETPPQAEGISAGPSSPVPPFRH